MTRAVYPGTFDPVHLGHLNLMERASAIFDELIIAVYDHGRPTKSVVFTVAERVNLIEQNVEHLKNVRVTPFGGLMVDFAKEIEADVVVRGLRVFSDFEFEFRMALANQRLHPKLETISLMTREEHTFLSGTTVREIASHHGDVSSMVPPNVQIALRDRYGSPEGESINRPVNYRD